MGGKRFISSLCVDKTKMVDYEASFILVRSEDGSTYVYVDSPKVWDYLEIYVVLNFEGFPGFESRSELRVFGPLFPQLSVSIATLD